MRSAYQPTPEGPVIRVLNISFTSARHGSSQMSDQADLGRDGVRSELHGTSLGAVRCSVCGQR